MLDEGWTSGLQPDLLAETHCTLTLDASAELATALLTNLARSQARRALTLLTRAARHQPGGTELLRDALQADLEHLGEPAISVAIETGDPLSALLADAVSQQAPALPFHLVQRLSDAIPEQTLALRETALVVAQALMDHYRATGDLEALAGTANDLSKSPQRFGPP